MFKIVLQIFFIGCFILYLPKLVLAEVWAKTLDGSFYTSIKNTPFGITIGEKDSRTQLQPYNGVMLSNDLGKTWTHIGLNGRGVTSLFSRGLDLFATTYYLKNNEVGLFYTTNSGATWQHLGQNYSASAVFAEEMRVYAGYYSHGLWVSFDNGATFVQKIGTNNFGPTVLSIESNGNTIIVGTDDKTYISIDKGNNWTEITELANKQINQIVFVDNFIFVGTFDLGGIYLSKNNGQHWEKLENFGTTTIGGLFYYQNTLYAGKYDNVAKFYSIYKSTDLGKTWENTGLNLVTTGTTTNISYIYAQPTQIIAAISKNGIFKMNIEPISPKFNKFLNLPWHAKNNNEIIDKIYSFFDHSYPLLGDNLHKEPNEDSKTTLNFLGQLAYEPELYYSSHSGIDFGLSYGTPVLAPANGVASYFFCKDCGHSIKIDHLNGYQTIYEHLQNADLVVTSGTKAVNEGDVIGKVGLTGNTSGPHLHFEVTNDSNSDNSFSDEFPHGRVDPFGWLNTDFSDPWQNYYWQDTAGDHTGTTSKYLWNIDIPQVKATITSNSNNKITSENKTFDITNIATLLPFNFEYQSFSQPRLPTTQQNLKYVANTSFILEILDTLKNKITSLPNEINIEILIPPEDLDNLTSNSIKLYYYESVLKAWKPLPSTIDLATGILRASTTHLSRFAVFAEPTDNTPPETLINIIGSKENDWYIESPKIVFSSTEKDLDKTFYSLDDGNTWNEFFGEFTLNQNGFVTILYRSSDLSGNYENAKTQLVLVNKDKKPVRKTAIINTKFEVN